MKKGFICLLLCLCLGLFVAVPAFAEGELRAAQETLDYVTDQAGILTESERESLNATAQAISERYTCGVYIVVVQDFKSFTNSSIEQCAEDLYHHFGLGLGDSEDGLLLLMSMAERDYGLWGYGPFAKYAFTDYGLDRLEDSFLPYFRENNWSGGFSAYLRGAEQLLDAAASGEPVAYTTPTSLKAAVALGPASLIGFIVCGVFKGQMKTAKEKETAEDYVVQGSAKLCVKKDQFINTTRTVQVIERDSGGSRGGGGGGTSHHSGKF